MTVTNRLNLPEAIVKACSRERHSKPGEISATTLLKGMKEVILTERHWDELSADAADQLWALWGTTAHAILESEGANEFTEIKLKHEICGVTLTGTIDNYDMKEGVITDWKTASVWKVIYHDFADWTMQGLVYAWLLYQNGFSVKKCRFVALLKDHSKAKARYGNGYPKSPVCVYEFAVTADMMNDAEGFIRAKIEQYKLMRQLSDDLIPECPEKERWAEPEKHAVLKEGRKSAVKLFESREEADKHALALGAEHYAVTRPGEDRKCMDYCACNKFCGYYRRGHAGNGKEEAE